MLRFATRQGLARWRLVGLSPTGTLTLPGTMSRKPDLRNLLLVIRRAVHPPLPGYARSTTSRPHIDLAAQVAKNPPVKPASRPNQNPARRLT